MRLPQFRPAAAPLALAVAVLVTLALGGCSASGDRSTPPVTTTSAAPVPTTAAPRIDWSAPQNASLPDGWALTRCSGDAPLFCVSRDGKPVGQLESIAYALSTLPEFAKVLGERGEQAALEDHAVRFVRDFAADRAQGCGAGYTVTGEPVRRISAVDGGVVSYGFTGTLAGGAASERVAHYAGVRDNRLVLLVANASDPGGCLHDDETTAFTSAGLMEFEPLLDQLVTTGGLPRP